MGIFWNQGTREDALLQEAAQMKRYMDMLRCDPAFREKAEAAPERAAEEAGLAIRAEDARRYGREPLAEPEGLMAVFLKEKKEYRSRIREEAGRLRHTGFAAWHRRQDRRCDLELGQWVNAELMHLPLAFELSSGCSVGCPFCGLSAGRLNRVSRGDAETRKLFRDILGGALELLGSGVREAILYYATEPLDTPDYLQFAQVFREVCGRMPVMTTAVPMRDPEKMRSILRADRGPERRIHRFSLLSQEVFRQCAGRFLPEETLYVDFLPRYREGRTGLVQAGRGRMAAGLESLMTDQGTIACVSGFIVNIAERTLRLSTPCRADAQRPNGEMVSEPMAFTTAEEALCRMERICGRMRTVPEESKALALQPFLRMGDGDSFTLENPGYTRLSLEGKAAEICRILAERPACAEEICRMVSGEIPETQMTLAGLFRQGILRHEDGFDR